MDRGSAVLGHPVQFRYPAWDRIVRNGDRDRRPRPANIVHVFREVVGAAGVTPEVLMSRTAPDRAWVTRYAEAHGSPLVPAPTGQRTEAVGAPACRRGTASAGVACILTSVAQGRTFVSYTPRDPPSGGDPAYRRIPAGRKRFLHDYGSLIL